MPRTTVRLFREKNGEAPLGVWLAELERHERKVHDKCVQRILLLSQLGSELRRPFTDMLRDGIRELRVRVGSVNYRILYFFHGANAVCLSHGLKKVGRVPDSEIETALVRKKLVERDPQSHVSDWEVL